MHAEVVYNPKKNELNKVTKSFNIIKPDSFKYTVSQDILNPLKDYVEKYFSENVQYKGQYMGEPTIKSVYQGTYKEYPFVIDLVLVKIKNKDYKVETIEMWIEDDKSQYDEILVRTLYTDGRVKGNREMKIISQDIACEQIPSYFFCEMRHDCSAKEYSVIGECRNLVKKVTDL